MVCVRESFRCPFYAPQQKLLPGTPPNLSFSLADDALSGADNGYGDGCARVLLKLSNGNAFTGPEKGVCKEEIEKLVFIDPI